MGYKQAAAQRPELGRKGVVFTLISLLISAVLIATFFALQEEPLDSNISNVNLKIKNTNMYVSQMPEYAGNMVHIVARPAFTALINRMIALDRYAADFDADFEACLLTGRAPDLNVDCEAAGVNLSRKLEEIDKFARANLKINVTTRIMDISLSQTDPWKVTISINLSVSIYDQYAVWILNKTINEDVSIFGLNDPVYQVNTKVPASEYPSRFNINSSLLDWYEMPSTLNRITAGHNYFKYPFGPSFLDRLRGDADSASSNCCGIASIVEPKNVPDLGYFHMDYAYWNGECYSNGIDIMFNFWASGMTQEIRDQLGIDSDGSGLNGSVVTSEMREFTNMTNTDYLEIVTTGPVCP